MTVKENLLLGAYRSNSWKKRKDTIEYVYGLYPSLKNDRIRRRVCSPAGNSRCSKIGRGLMANPKLMMWMSLPSVLAPLIVDAVL